jgi:hypothetical protein
MTESQFVRSMKHESFRITMEQRQKEWALRQRENNNRFKVVRSDRKEVDCLQRGLHDRDGALF